MTARIINITPKEVQSMQGRMAETSKVSPDNDAIKSSKTTSKAATTTTLEDEIISHYQNKHPKKSVHFFSGVRVLPVLHFCDYTHEETVKTWYNDKEIKSIRSEVRNLATMAEQNYQVDPRCHCYRGLEYRTTEGWTKRMKNRTSASTALFDEQEFQWNTKKDDCEVLADIYHEYTVKCAIDAHQLALQDEREAMALYNETNVQAPSRKESIVLNRNTNKCNLLKSPPQKRLKSCFSPGPTQRKDKENLKTLPKTCQTSRI